MLGIFVLGVFIFALVKLGKPSEAAGRYNARAIPVQNNDEWEDDDE